MIRQSIFALLCLASAASAQEAERDLDLTPLLSSLGLADTITALQADPPGPARDFALGGAQFLRGVEKTLQMRYRHNADFGDLPFPVLRLPLPYNPDSAPFYSALVSDLFKGVVTDMQEARSTLSTARGEFGVTVDLTRVWFDINENGRQDTGESLMAAAGAALGRGAPDGALNQLTVRFDGADAAWLEAYTHLLEGFGHLILAFDPTEVIEEVNASVALMAEIRGSEFRENVWLFQGEEEAVDTIAVLYGAVNRPPDVPHVHAMRDNLLAMIDANRRFWDMVALETDNDREWIPGKGQISALGIEMPQDTSQRWLAVLDDAKDVLTGKQLVGHWRLDGAGGVNVAKLLENPAPVDLVTWVQGLGLADYLESGPVVDATNWSDFQSMFGGDALLFVVWLN
ncbi:hypothetical protein [uncultured Mameliella sp.]|uniref:hypothetical protein n=1 Tax=uncultured Mameliella sp. TaxID=1447087 RepID=UPI00261AAB0D|nr:hypothetical protein [uncultured Mameliella sp.]